MILACPDCRQPMDWSLDRVGDVPMLYTKCRTCDPAGGWQPVDIVIKPLGKATLWPPQSDAPLAPVDIDQH